MGLPQRIGRWMQVEEGEGWPLFYLFLRALLIALGTVAANTFQSALFLAHFEASLLPWQYAAMAIATVLVSLPFASLQRRFGAVNAERWLTFLLVAGMSTGFLLNRMGSPGWMVFLFTMWVQLPGVFGNLTLWDTAIGSFQGRRARVLLPIIAAGSNVGAILGGQLSALFARSLGNDSVLPMLMVVGAATALLASRPRPADDVPKAASNGRSPLLEGLASVKANALARNVTLIILFSTALFLGVDFVFKKALRDLYGPDADGMSSFLGLFYMGMNIVVFVVQTVAMGRLMGWLGIKFMSLATPVVVLAGLGVAIASGGIVPALGAAILAGSLRYTFFLNSRNQLTTPLTPGQKSAAGFLNRTLVTPIGTVLAGLIFLPVRSASAQVLAATASIFGLGLAWCAWRAAVAYRTELAASLAHRTLHVAWGDDGFAPPDPSVLADLENRTRSADPQEALFAATLLASWGELHARHLERPLASGLDAGMQALALTHALPDPERSSLLCQVVTSSPDLKLRLEALKGALSMRPDWLAPIGTEFWSQKDDTLRGMGAIALATAGQTLPAEEVEALAATLRTAQGILAPLRQRLAAWLLLLSPNLSDDTVVELGYVSASPPARQAFISAVGEWEKTSLSGVLDQAALDPSCSLEAMRILAQLGEAPRLAREWMSQALHPVHLGALLVSTSHSTSDPTPLLEASLHSRRLWYLALTLMAAERNRATLPASDLCEQVEERIKLGTVALTLAGLRAASAEERLHWEAEARQLVEAAFSWFERSSPEWHLRLAEIEYTLPKSDKRGRNAAMELLEEFCRGGREWFVAAIDKRTDTLTAALRPYLSPNADPDVPRIVAASGDRLLGETALLLHPENADTPATMLKSLREEELPMPALDPVLFQKGLALRSSGFFKNLATEVILDIASRAEQVGLAPKQVLFREGDPADGVFFVLSGELDVWMHGKVLNHLSRGSVLGEIALLDKGNRTATLVAATHVSLLKISPALFEEIMETYPGVALGVIGTLVEYIRRQSAPADPLQAASTSLLQLTEA